MLYLIESYQKIDGNWIHSLKIGHSKLFKGSRDKSYDTNLGPNSTEDQLIGKRHGDRMLERMFHLKFKTCSILKKSTKRYSEWCIYTEEMRNSFFVETEDSLGLFLWKNRETFLDPFRKREGKAKKVYNYLKEIYSRDEN